MKTMTRRWTIFGITTITAFVFAGVVIASQFAAPPDVDTLAAATRNVGSA